MTPRKAAIIGLAGSILLRLLYATLRVRIDDRAGVLNSAEPRAVWIFWHNTLILVPYIRQQLTARPKTAALISASKDGEILAGFLKRFNLKPVRGSSSRRGVAALIEMIRLIESGYDVGITPDGPRGPCYTFNPGAITLAQRSGTQILPVRVRYAKFWRLKSWDGFMIPKPFSRVDVTLLPLETVRQTDDSDEFESERNRIAAILRDGLDG
jgi:lysophospholipid acyltransferase (LPLAT)-like uncharacterized protein